MNEKDLKKRLVIKRKQVRNKLNLLKHGEMMQESMFNPITKHLKNIESKLQNSDSKNVQLKEEEEKYVKPIYNLTPKKIKNHHSDEFNNSKDYTENEYDDYNDDDNGDNDNDDDVDDDDDDDDDADDDANDYDNGNNDNGNEQHQSMFKDAMKQSYTDYLDQYDLLPRKYIDAMHQDKEKREFDQKYGVRMNESTEKFMIGDSPLYIDGSDVIVKHKRYKGTQGLYELLFKKKPHQIYTRQDESNYREIILKTNAYRRHYKPNKQVDGSKLWKYKKIIAPIAVSSGKGMYMEVTNNKIDYVHWDSVDELVNRLRLLLSSQLVGNNGHTNEINSIIEELKEAHIIA